MMTKRTHRYLGIALAATLVLSACGGDGDEQVTDADTDPAPADDAEADPAEDDAEADPAEDDASADGVDDYDPTSAPMTEVEGNYKVGLSMSYFGNGWQTSNQYGAQALADTPPFKDNVELIVTQAGPDVQRQNAQINELIAQGVDAIIGFAISPDGLNRTLREACDQGIVVVTYSGNTTEPCVHSVGVDYLLQGRVMAEWLVDQLDGEGRILMNHGVAGTGPATDRDIAAKEVFAEYPGIEIVAEFNGDWSSAVSQQAAAQALAANPDIDGVWSEAGADGVVRAMIAQGLPLVPTTGEGTAAWHRMLNDPELATQGLSGMSTADPGYDAPMALQLAIAALEGYEIPDSYVIPVPTVYQEVPGDTPEGIAAQELKECESVQEGCNVFAEGTVPDDYFVALYHPALPLELAAYVTGEGQ